MRNDDPGNALDGALDSALAQYSSVEPLAGLEQRVLDRVRAEGTARRIGFWRWVLAAGVAGTIAAGVWLERPVPHVVVAGKTGRPVIPASRQAGTPARLKSLKKRYGQARRAVPLSREERALVALVDRPGPDAGSLARPATAECGTHSNGRDQDRTVKERR